jgi:hypothetical protein
MPRNLKIALGFLGVAVLIGLISLGSLRQHVTKLEESENSEEQSRREVLAPPISTPTDVTVTAKIFWATGPERVAPLEVELPLSADPVQRARQVVHALISQPPTPQQRTLPANAALLSFYVVPDGTAIADFSEALSSEMPSGILSEKLVVESIARTLESNVPGLKRLKILIHGQEAETLAGHLDLTGFIDLNSSPAAPTAPPAKGSPHAETETPHPPNLGGS